MLKKIRAWIKLHSAPGIGDGKAIRLAKELGEPKTFIEKNDSLLSDISYLSMESIDYLKKKGDPPGWTKTAKIIESKELKFCSILDESYPEMLRRIPEAPAWFFYLGNLKKEDFLRNLSIVGTRKPSVYARIQCKKLTNELVQRRFTIISGLAYGIDALAHNTALNGNGRTIAVMGCGLDQIYPSAHRHLSERIRENGAILSEQIPGSKINPWNFVQRNRIISGLSYGSWIVEGGKGSGALITAKYARLQKRKVFVLPGDIDREGAKGSNELLNNGALAVLGYRDILTGLGIKDEEIGHECPDLSNLNDMEKKVYQLLVSRDSATSYDRLLVLSGYTVSQLSTLLLSLELKGLVKKVAGNKLYPLK